MKAQNRQEHPDCGEKALNNTKQIRWSNTRKTFYWQRYGCAMSKIVSKINQNFVGIHCKTV